MKVCKNCWKGIDYIPKGDKVELTGGYFEVDFSTLASSDIFLLKHIALLMYTDKFSFIMTKADGASVELKKPTVGNREIVIHEMICGFNRQGFFKPNEIFSEESQGASSITGVSDFQIIFESDFQFTVPTHDFTDTDIEIQKYFMLFTTGSGKADLTWYMSDIKTGSSEYCKIIRSSLGI